MLATIFAINLKLQRKMRGLSQEKLAMLSGLHRTYIAGIETARRNVSLKNIEKLALALEISAVEFFQDPDKTPNRSCNGKKRARKITKEPKE